jgi:hypothetical protein
MLVSNGITVMTWRPADPVEKGDPYDPLTQFLFWH